MIMIGGVFMITNLLNSNTSLNLTKKTLTVKEFASMYGIGENKAYEIVNSENFPKIRCGKKIIILASKLDEWFDAHIGSQF